MSMTVPSAPDNVGSPMTSDGSLQSSSMSAGSQPRPPLRLHLGRGGPHMSSWVQPRPPLRLHLGRDGPHMSSWVQPRPPLRLHLGRGGPHMSSWVQPRPPLRLHLGRGGPHMSSWVQPRPLRWCAWGEVPRRSRARCGPVTPNAGHGSRRPTRDGRWDTRNRARPPPRGASSAKDGRRPSRTAVSTDGSTLPRPAPPARARGRRAVGAQNVGGRRHHCGRRVG
jgi:hypothetical protein